MVEQLISFETAKLAKQIGFNIETDKVIYPHIDIFEAHRQFFKLDFYWDYKFISTSPCWADEFYFTPTQSLLQKWLREKYSLHVQIDQAYAGITVWLYQLSYRDGRTSPDFKTYEDALEAGLIAALKMIRDEE